MVYSYNEDEFLSKCVEDTTIIETFETVSLEEVGVLNITNPFYVERLVVNGVYKRLAGSMLEAHGDAMEKKVKYYKDQWDHYYTLATTSQINTDGLVVSAPFRRS